MNKKAFTLIELLAVIAILAIIMVIAVPTVLNTISTSKKGAFKDNALSVIKAVENKIMTNALEMNEGINITNGTYMMIEIKDVDIDNKTNVNGYVYVVNNNNEIKYYISMYNKEYIVCQTEKNSITTNTIMDNKTSTCNDIENFMFNNVKDSNNKLVTTTNTDTNKLSYAGTINNLKFIKKIIVGESNQFILYEDGSLYGWGNNANGELGVGDKNSRSEPIKINVSGNVVDFDNYMKTSIALTEDGTVYTWGDNSAGQIGDGTTVSKLIPTKVIYFNNNNVNIKSVHVGDITSYAVDIDNNIYAFGYNGAGELGDGTTTNSSVPKKVNFPNNYKINKIWGFYGSAVIVLLENGEYYGFGNNSNGTFGNGLYQNYLSPTKLSFNGISNNNIIDLYLSGGTLGFLLNDGSFYTVGFNESGELGDGTTNKNNEAKKVNLVDKVDAVFMGRRGIIVRLKNGDYYSWGRNTEGQLGDGTKTNRLTPVKITIKQSNLENMNCNIYSCIIKLNDNSLYTVGSTYKYDKKLDFQSFYYGQ